MQYVHKGKVRSLPRHWKFENGYKKGKINILKGMTTGNFDIMPPEVHLAEGFLLITTENGKEYDPEIQTRTGPTITEHPDHAELDYVVDDKPLAEVQEAKKKQVKLEGRELFKAKWDLEYRIMGMYTSAEATQMDADKDTLLSYYKTQIEPQIDNAGNPQAVKDITYTWPAL